MKDAKALTAGDEKEYTVGGKKLTLRPLPMGQLKAAMKILETGDAKDWMGTIASYLAAVFDKAEHDFLTKEWIENNMSMPQANAIIADVATVNGLPNFLQAPAKAPTEERELMEATPAK